ncbi:hypothetical protein [Gordonia caeni]|uniref:Permease n=1 Tax=Gordonia caeni TaxID=1007097 RepID=A0ABP7PJ04_9ACTN
MNRDITLEASLAIAVGLLIVTWAAFRSTDPPAPGALRRGGMAATLTYAVLAVPVLVTRGLTLIGLIVLLVATALAFTASTYSLHRSQTGDGAAPPETAPERYARCAVSIGVAAVLLIAAGQTLSLLSSLDPRVIVLAVAVVAAWIAYAQGLAATHRVGSVTMWLMFIPIVLCLALGIYLGSPGVIITPIRDVDGVTAATGVGIVVLLIVIGWADNTLRNSALIGHWSRWRTLAGPLIVAALIVIGLLMLLGGSILVPSMEFFTVPANLDMLPGLAGGALAILTVLFTALVAHAFSGAARAGITATPGEQNDEFAVAPAWLLGAAITAAVLALLDPGAGLLLLLTALVAAALMGTQLAAQTGGPGRAVGLAIGVVAGVIVVIVLFLTGQTGIGWWTSLAVVVTAVVAFMAATIVGPRVTGAEAPHNSDAEGNANQHV